MVYTLRYASLGVYLGVNSVYMPSWVCTRVYNGRYPPGYVPGCTTVVYLRVGYVQGVQRRVYLRVVYTRVWERYTSGWCIPGYIGRYTPGGHTTLVYIPYYTPLGTPCTYVHARYLLSAVCTDAR